MSHPLFAASDIDTSGIRKSMPRILIIEDDDPLRESLVDILRLSHYEILTASDGQSGLAQAQMHLPDAITLDLRLPDMDGYAVLRALKATPNTLAIPVVVISGYTLPEDTTLALELGATAYITKPFSVPYLLQQLAQALETNT